MKSGKIRRLFSVIVLCVFLFSDMNVAWGCTSLIVGKDASASGYAMFSRTEDSMSYGAKRFFVYPAGYYKKGQTFVDPSSGFSWQWTHDSYKMTAVPDMPANNAGIYDEGGVNERGLMVSSTNTTTRSAGANAADPLNRTGLSESPLNTIILGEAATSEEALKLWSEIIEQYGMSEMCFWMMNDSKGDLWITENCGGHRWVAARVPDDSFVVVANDNVIDYVDLTDTKNFRGSKDLIEWAVSYDFAVYGPAGTPEEGKVNIAASYGTPNATGNSYRRWMGYNMFASSQNIELKAAYNATVVSPDPYPYKTFVKPDKKISALDIMEFQRSRFEGTPYDVSESPQVFSTSVVPGGVNMYRETENAQIINVNNPGTTTNARPIGHYTQMESHIYEYLPELPPEIGARWWFQESQPEHSVNLPFYGNITDTHPAYKKNVPYMAYDPESAFWIFREVSYLARSNRKQYGHSVHDYWHAYETKLYKEQDDITKELIEKYKANPKEAAEWITDYTFATSQAAMNRAGLIRKALLKHIDTRSGDLFVVPSNSIPFTNGTFDIHPTAGTANISDTDITDVASTLGISEWTVKRAYLKLPSPYPVQRYTPILYTVEDLDTGHPSSLGNGTTVLPMPGVRVHAELQSPDLSAGNLIKVRHTAEIQGDVYKLFENSVENVKKYYSLHSMLPGYSNGFELVGPNGLVSLSDAAKTGKALVIGDKERATVIIDFYLYDDTGVPAYGNGGKIVIPDGKTDNVLDTSVLWAAAYKIDKGVDDEEEPIGCQSLHLGALLGAALIGLIFRRKRY